MPDPTEPAAVDMAAVVLEVLEQQLDGYGLHTGGSYGVEYDHNEKLALLKQAAQAIAERLIERGVRPERA